jgi:predicted transcriptional regulator
MRMKIKNLIKKDMISVEKGSSGLSAIKIMHENGISSLPITEKNKVVGILTERDVIKSIANGYTMNRPVEELGHMGKIVTIMDDDPISKAAEEMNIHNIRHLIVLSSKDKTPIGIVSVRDLITDEQVILALSSLSEENIRGSD